MCKQKSIFLNLIGSKIDRSKRSKILILMIICHSVFSSCVSTRAYVGDYQRLDSIYYVAVLPFSCYSSDIGTAVSEALSARLLHSRFRVIERFQFEKLLNKQGLTLSDVIEDQTSVIGKIEGVDAIIVGNVTVDRGFSGLAFGGVKDYVSSATARMIDLITGELLIAANFSAPGPTSMSGVTSPSEVGEKLAKEIALKSSR